MAHQRNLLSPQVQGLQQRNETDHANRSGNLEDRAPDVDAKTMTFLGKRQQLQVRYSKDGIRELSSWLIEKLWSRFVNRSYNHALCIMRGDCMVFTLEFNLDTVITQWAVRSKMGLLMVARQFSPMDSCSPVSALSLFVRPSQKWLLCKIFPCTLRFASSELVRYPTSGGQYHWVAQLSPPRFRVIFSWAAGILPSFF